MTAVESTARAGARLRAPATLAYLIYVEVVKVVRIPMFAIFTILFPTLLFAMFGLPSVNDTEKGIIAGRYMMSSFGAYAVMGVALFSFGVAIASERGMGWNKLLRATPMNPLSYFIAKIAMAVLVGLATVTLLYLFAGLVAHVQMGLSTWVGLVGLLMAGMVPFVALGLWLGYLGGPQSAAVLANLINLPLSFASGLFIPVQMLPDVVQKIAPYLPSYHVAQLGWTFLGAGDGKGMGYHLVWLAGYTVVFLALAVVWYRRDEGKTFG